MSLSIAQVRTILTDAKGDVTLTPQQLEHENALELFDDYLFTDALTVHDPEVDLEALTATGRLTLARHGADLPCTLRFLGDAQGADVSAVVLDVQLPDWRFRLGDLDLDLGFLGTAWKAGRLHAVLTLGLSKDSGTAVAPRCVVRLPGSGADPRQWEFDITPSGASTVTASPALGEGLPLSALADLAQLPFGSGADFALPAEIPVAAPRIRQIQVVADTEQKRLCSVWLRVGLADHVAVIPGTAELTSVEAEFTLTFPEGGPVRTRAALHAGIGVHGYTLSGTITVPELEVTAEAAGPFPDTGTPAELASGSGLESLPVAHATVRADLREGSYALALGYSSPAASGADFALENAALEIAGHGSGAPDVRILGELAIGSARVRAVAARTTDGRWELAGSVRHVDFASVAEWLSERMGVTAPEFLRGVVLDDLSVTRRADGSFAFSADSLFPLGSRKTELLISAASGTGPSSTGHLEATLSIGLPAVTEPMILELQAQAGGRVQASWKGDAAVSVADLVEWLGGTVDDSVRNLLPKVTRLDLMAGDGGVVVAADAGTVRAVFATAPSGATPAPLADTHRG
ncbi:hypothetical protein IPZ58_32550 [Streptomyces roseoverticillatus]|uniref:hypothetical protein n=1 Tax=Streptomyces roseoverticillatus TaxID=66429 RepID=UPI001F3A87BC|nr:hypothetical protein [Streptomyces roseoverticillatus]MCF3106268.1 hypothetical protein [Streptomyces roseoverticillatus]